MKTRTNLHLKLAVPYDINETELSNGFKENNENFIEKLKILISFELNIKLSHCNN